MKIKSLFLNYGTGWIDFSRYIKHDIVISSRACSDDFHYAQNVANFNMLIGKEPDIPDSGTNYYTVTDWTSTDNWNQTIYEDWFPKSHGGIYRRSFLNLSAGVQFVVKIIGTASNSSPIIIVGENSNGDFEIIGNANLIKGHNIVKFIVNPIKTYTGLGFIWDGNITYEIEKLYVGTGEWVSNYDIIHNISDIKVKILDENNSVVFTGIIEKVPEISYNGIYENSILKIEAVDSIKKADVAYEDEETPENDLVMFNCKIMDSTNKANSVVHQMLYRAGFTDYDIADININITLSGFCSNDTKSILSQLDTLLYEYGYAAHMDEQNLFHPIKWLYQENEITYSNIINENNIVNEINISITNNEYDAIKLKYCEMGWKNNVLLYRENLPYNSDGSWAGYFVPQGYYYPIDANIITDGKNTEIYQEYTDNGIKALTNKAIAQGLDFDAKTAMSAFTSDFNSIIATRNHYITYSGVGLNLVMSNFYNKKARILYQATPASGIIYYMNIYGDVLYKKEEQTIDFKINSTSKKYDTYTATYVADYSNAALLAKALLGLQCTKKETYEFTSENTYSVGSFVKIKLNNYDEIAAFIIESEYDNSTHLYTYTCRNYPIVDVDLHRKTLTSISDNIYINDIVQGKSALNILTKMADDGIITPQEKGTVVTDWCQWYNDTNATQPLPVNPSINGKYLQIVTLTSGVGIWTPTVSGSKAKIFYDALESLRQYLFNNPGVILYDTWNNNITINKNIWINLWSNVNVAADNLTAILSKNPKTLNSLSDAVDFNGQYGIYNGQRYIGTMPNTWTLADATQTIVATYTPKCLGLYPYVMLNTITGMHENDVVVIYSEIQEERGIYGYTNASWVKIISPTSDQISKCFLFVLDAVRQGYGTSSDYIGSSTSFETLLVRFLYALQMQLDVSGAIFSGGYNAAGDNPYDLPGIYLGGGGAVYGVGARFKTLFSNSAKVSVQYNGSWIMGSWGNENLCNAQQSEMVSVVTLSDGKMLCVYRRFADYYLVQRIRNTDGTWGSESTITTESMFPSIVGLSDGRVLCVYQDFSNGYLMQRIRNTDGTWGNEVAINTAKSVFTSLTLLLDGRVLCVYWVIGGSRFVERVRNTDGTWGNEITILNNVTILNPSIVTLSDGRVLCIYRRFSDGYLMQRIRDTDGTWGNESIVNNADSAYPSFIRLPNNYILCTYRRGSDGYLVQRMYNTNGVWENESIINAAPSYYSATGILLNGSIICVYSAGSFEYLYERINSAYYTSIPIGNFETNIGAGITEIGQNSNGTYIKFSDGTLICYGKYEGTIAASSGPSQGIAYSGYFPMYFTDIPCIAISSAEYNGVSGSARFETYSATASVSQWFCAVSNNYSQTLALKLKWLAVGRWI